MQNSTIVYLPLGYAQYLDVRTLICIFTFETMHTYSLHYSFHSLKNSFKLKNAWKIFVQAAEWNVVFFIFGTIIALFIENFSQLQ